MTYLKTFLYATLAVLLLWLVGFCLFSFDARHMRPHLSCTLIADGIVVLTGGPGRLQTGLGLLEHMKAKRLFISGVNPDVRPREILPDTRLPIDLGYEAQNTLQNAQETRAWVETHHIKTLIVVTSRYHMRRALLELSQRLEKVHLYAYPSDGDKDFLVKQAWNQYIRYNVALMRAGLRWSALKLGLG